MNDYKDIAPETFKINKEQPFSVPDGYFDDFTGKVHSKLGHEAVNLPHKKRSMIRYLKPVLGLAASFALVFMLVYWPLNSFLPEYLAGKHDSPGQEIETEPFLPSLEHLDENSFFSLLDETFAESDDDEGEFNDDELLTYLSAIATDYEIYMHTEN